MQGLLLTGRPSAVWETRVWVAKTEISETQDLPTIIGRPKNAR